MTPLQQYLLLTDNNNIFRNYAIKSYNHSKISPAVFSAICFSVNVFIFRASAFLSIAHRPHPHPHFVFKEDKKDSS